MTEFLRRWLLGLTGAAIVCGAAKLLTPRSRVKKVVELLCGVVMTVALLSPLGKPELGDYSLNLSRYRAGAEALTREGTALRESLDRDSIEQAMEAYILDKARTLGAELSAAELTLRWSTAGCWVPERAVLDGPYDAVLADILEAELGIPRSAQTWRNDEDA